MPFRSLLSVLLVLYGCSPLLGGEVSVEGQGPGYAHQSIRISVAYNPFVSLPDFTETIRCNESGAFRHSFDLQQGRVVQFEMGSYQTYIYMEPGFHYRVVLPPYMQKEYAELVSPFYQPVYAPLEVISRTNMITGEVVKGTRDVNYSISRFDTAFTAANEKVILERRLGRTLNLDSIEKALETPFDGDTSRFFSQYRRYRYGILRLNEGRTGLETISRNYLGPVIRDDHPGFIELFRAMFRDFLYYFSETPDGNRLRYHINRSHQVDSVRTIIRQHPAIWCDTLADMVLLQELSDLFYRGDYHKEAILILLDSMEHHPVSQRLAGYAGQVKEKLASLTTGHIPPPFQLPDLNGELVSSEQFKGRYTYLFFGTPDHYGCMMEYPFLQSFQEKHADYLQVVTIMVAEDPGKVKAFMERNGYSWKALYYDEQTTVLRDYQVRAFPMAYLLDPEGKLVLSPSPLPTDGFEQQLFRILRAAGVL
jgi:peroxiredoxin